MKPISSDALRRHRNELLSVLSEVASALENRERVSHPRAHVRKLWDHYRGASAASVLTGWRRGHAVRQVHDFYGWKAKDDQEHRGVCSGALYRTASYLSIPLNERSGKRFIGNVHIEHTIPVCVLARTLELAAQNLSSYEPMLGLLMENSICTAMSIEERKLVGKQCAQDSHKAFSSEGCRIDDFPFSRYAVLARKHPEFTVYNVLTGEAVDLNKFTFSDHGDTLRSAVALVGARNIYGLC